MFNGESEDTMNHLKIMHELLKEKKTLAEIPVSDLPFVTISREAGAGGHLLSYVLITDFLKQRGDLFEGWHVFDRQLCEIIAEDSEIQDAMDVLTLEDYRTSEFGDLLETLFTGRSEKDALFRSTCKVIRMLAAIGKVIVVGRAGCCVTRGMKSGIHIRLVASESKRVAWMMKRFQFSRADALKVVRKQDEDRAKLMKTFFNRDIGDPLLYDAVFDTDRMEMHDIAAFIINEIRERQKGVTERVRS